MWAQKWALMLSSIESTFEQAIGCSKHVCHRVKMKKIAFYIMKPANF